MPARGRKRKLDRNHSQIPGGSRLRHTNLPSQYDFTPAVQAPRTQQTPDEVPILPRHSTESQIRDYPPPQQLFQGSVTRQPPPQVRRSPSVEVNYNPATHATLQDDSPPSPAQRSQARSHQTRSHPSHPSSQGNNFEEETSTVLPELQEDVVRALNALLVVPGRDKFTTVLSPTPLPNTQWFTRDKGSKLVRKITKILLNKFEGPFYSWTCKTHTWDPLITGTVQAYFEKICQKRIKDMVSNVRTSGVQPNWIGDTLMSTMEDYWDTEEAQQKSKTYSQARMSDRNGLGPHVHLSGPKSYQQLQDEMVEELGREVRLGEVFIKAHTKPDGTYVDRKAEKIAGTYEKTVQERLSQLEAESFAVSDGESRPRDLTTEEYTEIFLEDCVFRFMFVYSLLVYYDILLVY
ncbi:PREDICTED: uncharacterized protein LOC109127991 [Camelina sativa]|uniref:Uncharacterized protein LOC109127991 n=1 Tax=Camelina sativa TaxID=90675 RepID=A0ABM1QR02_CAMSA|nr:PREDICTED: uncharacterized protein LOC109127991 [Camelina sativa]